MHKMENEKSSEQHQRVGGSDIEGQSRGKEWREEETRGDIPPILHP